MNERFIKRFAGSIIPMTLAKRLRYAWVRMRETFGLNYFPAHDDLDKKMLDYVGNIKGGTFVEAGANDGLAHSNTWHLERRLGWSGLLVEPVPENAELCRKFRRARVECCALGSFDQDNTTVRMHFGAGMSAAEGADASHLAGGSPATHAEVGAGWIGRRSYDFAAPIFALSTLLDRAGILSVDFMSLDVEGFETQALMGIDFDRHIIKHILVESSHVDDVINLLGRRYTLIKQFSHHDYLFQRHENI